MTSPINNLFMMISGSYEIAMITLMQAVFDTVILQSPQEKMATAMEHLAPVYWISKPVGFILMIIGFMAWNISQVNSYRRQWGKRLLGIGVVFVIVGFNFGLVWNLIMYALNQ